jgi:hypothetical protein
MHLSLTRQQRNACPCNAVPIITTGATTMNEIFAEKAEKTA